MSELRSYDFADMTVIGEWPAKMMKALAVIATELHPAYDRQPGVDRGHSKETCVFTSLCVRDFLVEIGYPDATGRPVAAIVRALDSNGKTLHSLGMGTRRLPEKEGKFNGHLVCTVPSLGLLIDATLHPAIRPQWGGALRGMMAAPYHAPDDRFIIDGDKAIAGISIGGDDRVVEVAWTDRPDVKWKRGIDFIRNDRRRAITRALVERFGQWQN